jgi:hypothetical protein
MTTAQANAHAARQQLHAQPARALFGVQPTDVATSIVDLFSSYTPCAGRHFPKIPGANSQLIHLGTAHLFGLTSAMKYVGGEDKWVAQMRYQSCGKKQIWCASMKQLMEAFSVADPDATQSIHSAASAFGRLDVKMAERCKEHGLTLQVAVAEEGDIVHS